MKLLQQKINNNSEDEMTLIDFEKLKKAAIYDPSGLGLNYLNLFCAIFLRKTKND